MKGFVFLPRTLKDWEWYCDSNVTRLYIHLILKANYTNKKWLGVIIKRGQLATSYNSLSEELGLTVQQIRTALQKLKRTGYITKYVTSQYTIVTLLKYEEYQTSISQNSNKISKGVTSLKQSKNNHVTLTEEMNKINKNNKEIIESRRGDFKKQVFEHTQYSIKILNEFFEYWTEQDLKTGKMRFEKETFFEIDKRLVRWQRTEKVGVRAVASKSSKKLLNR